MGVGQFCYCPGAATSGAVVGCRYVKNGVVLLSTRGVLQTEGFLDVEEVDLCNEVVTYVIGLCLCGGNGMGWR